MVEIGDLVRGPEGGRSRSYVPVGEGPGGTVVCTVATTTGSLLTLFELGGIPHQTLKHLPVKGGNVLQARSRKLLQHFRR